jgi:hypothetical protein
LRGYAFALQSLEHEVYIVPPTSLHPVPAAQPGPTLSLRSFTILSTSTPGSSVARATTDRRVLCARAFQGPDVCCRHSSMGAAQPRLLAQDPLLRRLGPSAARSSARIATGSDP